MNHKQILKGIMCIILSAFCFAFMNLFVNLSGELPAVQKSFFRNIIAFGIAIVLLIKEKQGMVLNKKNLPDLLLRSIFGTIGILCNFYAVDHLLLSDASMLNKMSPFFTIVFSYFILREKVSMFQAVAVLIAFLGSMLVVKPSFSNANFIPALIGLSGGICAGAAYTFVRKLGSTGTNGALIVAFFSAFSCLVTLPFLIFDFHFMTLQQLCYLLLAGISAAGGQFAITAAYSFAPAKEISVYDYSQILFSAILGYFIFAQLPDLFSVLGYLIIIAVAVFMFLYNTKGLFRKGQ